MPLLLCDIFDLNNTEKTLISFLLGVLVSGNFFLSVSRDVVALLVDKVISYISLRTGKTYEVHVKLNCYVSKELVSCHLF